MPDHKTAFPITVDIFEGPIDFGAEATIYKLIKGDIVALEASVPHNLVAVKNSIVRLTLSKLDTVERMVKIAES